MRVLFHCLFMTLFCGLFGQAESLPLEAATRSWLQSPDDAAARLAFQQAAAADKDVPRRAWAMVMLGLHDLSQGRGVEAEQWKLRASQLTPGAQVLLALDVRELTRRCLPCKGSGKQSRPCTACKGDGVCAGCNGRGFLEGLRSTQKDRRADRHDCPRCQGSRRCSVCRRGQAPVPCPACGARGRELDLPQAATRWRRYMKAGPDRLSGAPR